MATTIIDEGTLRLCRLENTADNGAMPVEKLVDLLAEPCWFGELSYGVYREYLTKGADERLDILVRIFDEGVRPAAGMYAVLAYYNGQINADGDQYQIEHVEPKLDDDGLRVFDLTLKRIGDNYDADT